MDDFKQQDELRDKANNLLATLRRELNLGDPPLRLYVERFQWPWYRKFFAQLKGTW